MRRRAFISLLGGGAAAMTLRSHPLPAQQSGRIYRIGFFGGALPASPAASDVMGVGYPAFRRELRKRGFIDGRHLLIEFRSTRPEGRRLHAAATDMLRST